MNAWEKTCDTWRLLAAELNASFTESTIPMTKTHLATVDKQYRNWKIGFQTTGHTITGSAHYVPLSNFTLNVKRKQFDWTDQLHNFIPSLGMLGSEVINTGFPEVEYLYSVDSNDVRKARTIMQSQLLRDVLMNHGQMQNFLICSIRLGVVEAGSILLFDLGQAFNRAEMKNRFDLFEQTLDELEHLDLASPEAPKPPNADPADDLFSKFTDMFKQK